MCDKTEFDHKLSFREIKMKFDELLVNATSFDKDAQIECFGIGKILL